MKRVWALLFILILVSWGCSAQPGQPGRPGQTGQSGQTEPGPEAKPALVYPEANTLEGRFSVPPGYERVAAGEHSFGEYLRILPLKPHGAKVRYYNGGTKSRDVYEAVVDLDIGTRDLQQCADAAIRLRAEYLFREKQYDDIHFNFTSGFTADYPRWRDGYRVAVRGNSASWVKTAAYSAEYEDFRAYLDTVFAYAGTLSLAKELDPVQPEDMQIGDVFIQGGSPGHCVIVVDMALNPETGERIFMLAQSYMPAQDIQILKNPDNTAISPWYALDFGDVLDTPEWTFKKGDLKRFQ
jgi:hypothetical protein